MVWHHINFWQETGSCCCVNQLYMVQSVSNSTFDKSPALKTSACQLSIILSASPTGNRKFNVFYLNVLLLAGWSTSSLVRKDLRPWWCRNVKLVSFHQTPLPWWRITHHETGSCCLGARDALKVTKLGTHVRIGWNWYLIWVSRQVLAKW